jgi:hypothetical protein
MAFALDIRNTFADGYDRGRIGFDAYVLLVCCLLLGRITRNSLIDSGISYLDHSYSLASTRHVPLTKDPVLYPSQSENTGIVICIPRLNILDVILGLSPGSHNLPIHHERSDVSQLACVPSLL